MAFFPIAGATIVRGLPKELTISPTLAIDWALFFAIISNPKADQPFSIPGVLLMLK